MLLKIYQRTLLKIEPQLIQKIGLKTLLKIVPQLLIKLDPQMFLKREYTSVYQKMIQNVTKN